MSDRVSVKRESLEEVLWCISPCHIPKASDNKDACLYVQVCFNFTFALISSSIFVGRMDGIAAVLLN